MNRSTRMSFACALALLALTASAAEFSAKLRARVLPDLFVHLTAGDGGLERGNLQAALAESDVILLRGTVKVSVAFNDIEHKRQADCLAALKAGIDAWCDALTGDTKFQLVDKPEDADVRVTYVRHLTVAGKQVGGHTQWRRTVKAIGDGKYSGKVSATVELIADCPNGRPMNAKQMRQAACHEFGHVLGLDDSPRSDDVMGVLNMRRPVTTPSREEIQALVAIREEGRRLRAKVLALDGERSATVWAVPLGPR